MLPTTYDAIKAICAADPSVSAAQVKAALAELSGKGIREMQGEPPPRAYTPAQVAELLGKSRRTISAYARRGLLTPIYSGATGARAQGYTGESVAALLSGKAKAKGSEVAA
jgi:hypothetical protein